MDAHTKIVISGLLMYSFDGVDWNFEKLTPTEKEIVGNQIQLNIIRKFCNNEFEKAMTS